MPQGGGNVEGGTEWDWDVTMRVNVKILHYVSVLSASKALAGYRSLTKSRQDCVSVCGNYQKSYKRLYELHL